MLANAAEHPLTRTVFFFWSPTCAVCAEAEPIFDEFLRDNPMLMAQRLNADKEWEVLGFRPRVTPTYLLVENGQIARKHEGKLSLVQVRKFVFGGSGGSNG